MPSPTQSQSDEPAMQSSDDHSNDSDSLTRRAESELDESRWGTLLVWVQPLLAGVVLLVLVEAGVDAVRHEREMHAVAGTEIDILTWMYGLAVAYLGVVLVPRILAAPERLRRLLGRLRARPFVALSVLFVAALFVVGSLAPFFLSEPRLSPIDSLQPPFWMEVSDTFVPQCVGPVVDGNCQGTLTHPLGTNGRGQDLLTTGLLGLNTTLQVALTAAVLAVTLGVSVGTVAGYRGGWVDELLMRYVDIQRAVPAFFLYILLTLIFEMSYPLMILVFGLLSWGGIARLVRSEVRQLQTTPYINAAQLSGARPQFIIFRHIVPNASNTIITAATVLFAKFIVFEAALAFLSLTDPSAVSLGNEIAQAVGRQSTVYSGGASRPLFDFWYVPWIVLVPAGILCSFLLTVSVLGDGLRDLVDPRT